MKEGRGKEVSSCAHRGCIQAWNLATTYTTDESVSFETFRRAVAELGF